MKFLTKLKKGYLFSQEGLTGYYYLIFYKYRKNWVYYYTSPKGTRRESKNFTVLRSDILHTLKILERKEKLEKLLK